MTAPLIVDGPRPAVEWVTSLPRSSVTDRERLVLLALACDAYQYVSAPGAEALASWCGLINGRLYEVLGSLTNATESRPALLERVDRHGTPIPAGTRLGRERTRYRLRVELDPGELSRGAGRDELSRAAGRDGEASSPVNSPEQLSRPTLPANSPEQLSQPAGRLPSLPLPSLPSLSSSVTQDVMSTEDGDVQEQGLVHDEITVDENVAPWDWWSEEPPEQDDNPGDVMPIENITEITEEEDDLPSYPSSWDDDPKDDFTEMTEDERRVLDTLHAAQSINRGPRSTEHITYTAAGQSSPPCAAATPLPPPSMALWRRGPS